VKGLAFFFIATMWSVPDARAELVFLSSGRSFSVRDVREEGTQLILALRTGGEIRCDRSLVDRITPDEMAYPEPPVVADVTEAYEAAKTPYETAATPYRDLIDRASVTHGVDARLVRAVIQVESSYQTRARSPKGAMGLMQLMPETARRYAVTNPFDPVANVEAGTRYLKSLLDRFPLNIALAAYNAGEAAVERFGGVPPYPETRAYVGRILKLVSVRADRP
jgi:soluble lytic murein transglycosylase-like protein